MSAAVFPTRRTRAHLRAQSRNAHREPSLFEIVIGLLGFVFLVATCLYVVAALGR